MIAYLDTNIVLWLNGAELDRLTFEARRVIREADLRLAPMVLLELQYLFEIHRSAFPSRDITMKLGRELGLRVCDLAFPLVAEAALEENWTREPFDRLIVAQAKANGYAMLVTADAKIRKHYPRTVW